MSYLFIFNQTWIILKLIVVPIKPQFMSVDKLQLVIPLLFLIPQYPFINTFYYSICRGYICESPWFLHFTGIYIKNFDGALNIYLWTNIDNIIFPISHDVCDIKVIHVPLHILQRHLFSASKNITLCV